MYKQVLDQPLGDLGVFARAKRLPVVLSQTEAKALVESLTGPACLMAALLYGSGLQKALKKAAREAGINKKIGTPTVRHYLPFVTMSGNPRAAMIYTHVLRTPGLAVRSPVDFELYRSFLARSRSRGRHLAGARR